MTEFVPSGTTMRVAIAQAHAGVAVGNYPIGAVVEHDGVVVASAFTELHTSNDPTAHAEMLVIRRAAEVLGNRYLEGCVLYTTLEPCPMCTSAALWARMDAIVFGATQADASHRARTSGSGAYTWRQIDLRCADVVARATPSLVVHEAFLRDECLSLLDVTP